MNHKNSRTSRSKRAPLFDRIASRVTRIAGSSYASIVAFLLIVGWAITGPIFNFSDTWQLVINTGTTIITFLMVFIIQQTQNKDTIALHLKLNELIACNAKASNRLIDIESLSQDELETAHRFYARLAMLAEKERDLYGTHSLDQAKENHENKMEGGKTRSSTSKTTEKKS